MRTLYGLSLMSKNNTKTGSYLYSPTIKENDKYYFCEMLKSNKPLKPKDVDIESLVIKREIPKEFYKAHKIVQ